MYIGIALCLCAVNLSQKPDNVPLDGFYKLMYLAYAYAYIVNMFFLFRYNDIFTSFVCAVCSLASVMISNNIPNQITGAFNVLLFLISATMFVYHFWF